MMSLTSPEEEDSRGHNDFDGATSWDQRPTLRQLKQANVERTFAGRRQTQLTQIAEHFGEVHEAPVHFGEAGLWLDDIEPSEIPVPVVWALCFSEVITCDIA